MSKLFTKLKLAPKVWTDDDFEELFNRPKVFDFFKELGRKEETWAAWSSFLERKKLDCDYKTSTPCWFHWVYWHVRDGGSFKGLYLSVPVQKQIAEYLAFNEVRLAKQEKERILATERQREEWRKRKRKAEAEHDRNRVAYRWFIPDEDIKAFGDRKKDYKDLRRLIEETPFGTTSAQVDQHYVWEKEGTPEQKLVDVFIECSNYGLTYSPEDMQAINAGKKDIKKCQPIVKAYPVPVITVNEEVKRQFIDQYNAAKVKYNVPVPEFFERSDQKLRDQRQREYKPPDVRRYLRKPGTPRQIGGGQAVPSDASSEAGQVLDLARRYLKKPKAEAPKPQPPPPVPPPLPENGKGPVPNT
jgi:hypothetical protein